MALWIRDELGTWREPVANGYDNVAVLQSILAEHPAFVPGVNGEAIACREFESRVGPADVVILDSEGSITVVERKLRANAVPAPVQMRSRLTSQPCLLSLAVPAKRATVVNLDSRVCPRTAWNSRSGPCAPGRHRKM